MSASPPLQSAEVSAINEQIEIVVVIAVIAAVGTCVNGSTTATEEGTSGCMLVNTCQLIV